jgi:hypothetical protein
MTITEEILEELIEKANAMVVNRYIEMKCDELRYVFGRKLAKERIAWSSIVVILIAIIIYQWIK